MLKHMKYELRKSMFSKIVILIVTAIAEIAFLVGVFAKNNEALAWGVGGIMSCALVGIFYIGIESLITFHRDLNTKQSYMLFMTPYSSYEILGAKIVQNAVTIFAAGAFFVLLAVLDAITATVYLDGLKALIEIIQNILREISVNIDIRLDEIIMVVALTLVSWLMMIVTGYLAIILCATVLAGKKISGFVSFVIYILINYVSLRILDLIPPMKNGMLGVWLMIGLALVITAVMYVVSGWIMERKLSV